MCAGYARQETQAENGYQARSAKGDMSPNQG
jgi:hypothetical protein